MRTAVLRARRLSQGWLCYAHHLRCSLGSLWLVGQRGPEPSREEQMSGSWARGCLWQSQMVVNSWVTFFSGPGVPDWPEIWGTGFLQPLIVPGVPARQYPVPGATSPFLRDRKNPHRPPPLPPPPSYSPVRTRQLHCAAAGRNYSKTRYPGHPGTESRGLHHQAA